MPVERPIIMGAESVRAILAGRKTQTRRVIKRHPEYGIYDYYPGDPGDRQHPPSSCVYSSYVRFGTTQGMEAMTRRLGVNARRIPAARRRGFRAAEKETDHA